MKFIVVMPGDKKLVLTATQLEIFMSAIDGAEMLVDKHVGNHLGTHGYNNAYIHDVETRRTIDWFTVIPVDEDYVDTLKLAAKLEKEE